MKVNFFAPGWVAMAAVALQFLLVPAVLAQRTSVQLPLALLASLAALLALRLAFATRNGQTA